jgi:hypothetical protein
MSSGAKSGATVIQAARRWGQPRATEARHQQPLEHVCKRRRAEAVLSGVSARDQVHHDMLRMMWHFSADPGRVPPRFRDALRAAEQVCADCLVVARCHRWFRGRLSSDTPRLFCPNAELYEDIADSQPAGF